MNGFRVWLDLFDQAVILLDDEGSVLGINKVARRKFSDLAEGRRLEAFCSLSSDEATREIKRWRRTSGSQPFLLNIHGPDNESAFRGNARTLRNEDGTICVALIGNPGPSSRFIALTDKVERMNSEIAKRKRTEADLRASLEKNTLLMRELKHRVKNNVQIQMSLLEQQARASGNDVAQSLAKATTQRLWSLSQALQVMYSEADSEHVVLSDLLGLIIDHLDKATGDEVTLTLICPASIRVVNENANAYALLMNELVTNAIKHGLTDGSGEIAITVSQDVGEDELSLIVSDPGTGFDTSQISRSSFGLKLVKTLCRQLNGHYETQLDDIFSMIVRVPMKPMPIERQS